MLALAAAAVVVLHFAFVSFVITGGFLAWRWKRVVYAHVPAVLWGIYVEWAGIICPLTPLENALRASAGLDEYSGDFVARYLLPVLYPEGLTRTAQFVLGAIVVIVNVVAYGRLLRRRQSIAKQ